MSAIEIGTRLVSLCNDGKSLEAVDSLYAPDIVSIEGSGGDGPIPQRMEGIEAVRGKTEWWLGAHEIHTNSAAGPFVGHREDQFAVLFEMDVTNKESGERTAMSEVALYTIADGKIVQEEFLYRMG